MARGRVTRAPPTRGRGRGRGDTARGKKVFKSTFSPTPKSEQIEDLCSASTKRVAEFCVVDDVPDADPPSARTIQRRDSSEAAERALLDRFPHLEQKICALQNARGETPVDKVRIELRRHGPKTSTL